MYAFQQDTIFDNEQLYDYKTDLGLIPDIVTDTLFIKIEAIMKLHKPKKDEEAFIYFVFLIAPIMKLHGSKEMKKSLFILYFSTHFSSRLICIAQKM